MLARVAGSLFWLNRYLQRVENTSRLINVHANLLMDLPDADTGLSWLTLVSIAGHDEDFSALNVVADESTVCRFLITDRQNPGSLVSNLNVINENLRSSRDCMSSDLYAAIKQLYRSGKQHFDQTLSSNQRQVFLSSILQQSLAITGAMESTISHDSEYYFLRIGGLLERADMTSRVLDVRSANLLPADGAASLLPFENLQWVSLLRSLSAFQMYMKKIKKPVQAVDVLSFLLQNRKLPQAYLYCLTNLAACINKIDASQKEIVQLSALIKKVEQADIALLARNKQHLHEFVDQLQIALIEVSNEISNRYFLPEDSGI